MPKPSTVHPIAHYLACQACLAVLLPLVFANLAVLLDIAGVGSMLTSSAAPVTALVLIMVTAVTSFAPMIFATAVVLLAD